MDIAQVQTIILENIVPVGTSIVTTLGAAFLFWYLGRRVILFAVNIVENAMVARKLDDTVRQYVRSALEIALTVALAVAIFGYLGVETTTFAALLAGAGLAIGTAWGDLLKNFAAGVFMLILRPFRVGDFVTAASITGTVAELGMFTTTINTPDNVRTIVGNGAVFASTIQNFSTNAYRRVDLVAQLAGDANWEQVIMTLRERVAQIPNVASTPAPDVFILTFSERGPVLCVRPYTHTDHYWQVYFDTNEAIARAGAELKLPTPTTSVRMLSA